MTTDPRYPVGRWSPPPNLDTEAINNTMLRIAKLPEELRSALRIFSEAQLDLPYRPGGWTVRQVVHHLADSHSNAYIRCRLTLTEDEPVIKPYDQEAWARLPDASGAPIALSLDLLTALHSRWILLLRAVPANAWSRRFQHPEMGIQRLDLMIHHYAWHGDHHVAQIKALGARIAETKGIQG